MVRGLSIFFKREENRIIAIPQTEPVSFGLCNLISSAHCNHRCLFTTFEAYYYISTHTYTHAFTDSG